MLAMYGSTTYVYSYTVGPKVIEQAPLFKDIQFFLLSVLARLKKGKVITS